MKERIWDCTVITYNEEMQELPNGADAPPRKAVVDAIEGLGLSIHSVSSGWGSEEFTPKIASLKKRVAQLESEVIKQDKRIAELSAHFDALMQASWELKEGHQEAFYKVKNLRSDLSNSVLAKRDLEKMAVGIEASINFYVENTSKAIQGHIDYGILGKAKAENPDAIPIEILKRDIKALRNQAEGAE